MQAAVAHLKSPGKAGLKLAGKPPLADYPNRLFAGASVPAAAWPRVKVLACLLVAALLPRLWMAWNLDVVCPDGVTYLGVAESLRQGNFTVGYEDLNIYPAILLLLHGVSSHWIIVCEAWSLLLATLAILPLYGLVRRQLDDRVATVACLLYALHPKLVVYAPLILRDPTFGFFFLLSLYLLWRAVTEEKWWQFATAGGSLFLTIHTRTEGWLLLIPLLTWSGGRLLAAPAWRRRLLWGAAICVTVIPLATVAINVTVLRDQPSWHVACTRNFVYAWHWLRNIEDPELPPMPWKTSAEAAPAGQATPVAALTGTWSELTLMRKVIVRFVKTFTYMYGLVVLAGVWSLRRNLARTDTLPYFLITTATLVAIWVRYNYLAIDERYFFTIVLVVLPGTAVGVLQIAQWGVDAATRLGKPNLLPRAAIVGTLFVVVAVGAAIDGRRAAGNYLHLWRQQAELGKWILEHQGPQQRIIGDVDEMRIVAYYAQGYLLDAHDPRVAAATSANGDALPEVITFWGEGSVPWNGSEACVKIVQHPHDFGYQPVPRDSLPPPCRQVQLFVRHD